MKQFEIPTEEIYKGEESCPYPRGIDEDNFYSRRQWFFEKHYEQSPFNRGIPFLERFSFTGGFEQYLYFKGETKCPFSNEQGEPNTWWHMEQRHWSMHGEVPYVIPFIIFFRNWIDDRAAGNVSHDIEVEGNPWLDRYLIDAPL